MKKSKISKILLLGASALLLTSITACGDDKSNQPAEGNSNVDTGTETTPSTNNSGNQENNSGTGEGQSQSGDNNQSGQGQQGGQEQTAGGENQGQSGQGEGQQGGEGQGQGQQGQENQNNNEEPASDSTVSQDVITAASGYTEGATLTFNVTSANLDKAFVSYSSDNGTTWSKIDNELIRFDSNTNKARADILGLKAGSYKVKADNGVNYTIKDITVTKDDRSGYAHFNNNKGIGAYNNDGTLKSNAIVVYVNDANKNTVKATVNGKEQTGLANIIKAATNANESLDIRILGEIQTEQWNYKAHGTGKSSARQSNLDSTFSAVDWDLTTENELKNPGTSKSSNYKKISEADIIAYGINSMSEDKEKGITHLNGLTNNILKEISSGEYDSYYNELDVKLCNNITIEGVGTDAKIFQWGLCFNQCNSIEVKNIEFSDYTEDAIGIQGSNSDITLYSDYWIHNCTFNKGKNNWDVCYENDKTDGDGSTDFKYAHDLTISYCRYNGTHKTALIGSSSSSYQYNVTFHHNYYNSCGSRLPFTRQTNFHIYNCYYNGSTGTNMQIQSNAYAFIEGCYFENTKNTFTTSDGGVIKLYNNTINSTSSVTGSNVNYVTSRTELVSNSCNADKTTDFSSFDTNKALFYYDDTNNVSKVDLMLQSTEVKSYIPTVAGAGLLATIDYSKNYTETNEGYVDTTVTATYNYSEVAPTSSGLYYTVLDNSNPQVPLTEANVTSTTIVKEKDGKITITDTNANATTIGYYMLEDAKRYTTGTHTYTINLSLGNVGGNWAFIRLLDANGAEFMTIGAASSNKYMCYTYKDTTQVVVKETAFAANKTYTISLTVDYDNDTASITIDGTTAQIASFDTTSISGIKLFTAKAAADRSFTVNSITIA
ncbi:MAG: hypothetical protein IKR19_03940 [Acholeplasmatales bacterium]|nr:hypothetical protein [Acholeplasmatales bacterium]